MVKTTSTESYGAEVWYIIDFQHNQNYIDFFYQNIDWIISSQNLKLCYNQVKLTGSKKKWIFPGTPPMKQDI